MHRLSEPIAAIPSVAVKPLRRIVKKGRKYGEERDRSWEDVLRENIETEAWVYEVRDEENEPRSAAAPPEPDRGRRLTAPHSEIEREPTYDEMIEQIRKLADSPEQLVDSHMGIMMESVMPGKWVSAAG